MPINNKFKAQAMFSFEPISFLESQNRRIFYTQSLSRETIIEFTEIDLTQSNLNKTSLELSPITKFGFGFGKNKKWFFGAQYNLTKTLLHLRIDSLKEIMFLIKIRKNGL